MNRSLFFFALYTFVIIGILRIRCSFLQVGVRQLILAQGIPSPPGSPPFGAVDMSDTCKGRARGAAYVVAGECERLFCGALRAAFLGEGNVAEQAPIAADTHNYMQSGIVSSGRRGASLPSPPDLDLVENGMRVSLPRNGPRLVQTWIEVWDYAGGAWFRGFVAGDGDEKTLFVFFDDGMQRHDLKPG